MFLFKEFLVGLYTYDIYTSMPGMDKILFNLKFTARSMEKEAAKMERLQKQNNDKALACVNDDVRAIPASAILLLLTSK
jgi:hypothetical protein